MFARSRPGPRVPPRLHRARLAIGALLLAVTAACSSVPSLPSTGALPIGGEQGPGFVTRAGNQLQVDGAPWRFAGYNLPCAQPFLMSADELGFYLDNVKATSGANVIRAWFFQSNGGPANWEPFDRVMATVKAKGMRVVATLTDEWNGGCDAGTGTEKTIDWYQGGYRQPDLGHALAYRDYAAQVAARYADEPAIAMWQLVNEAQANAKSPSGQLTCDNTAGQQALRSFADDMVGVVKAADPNHLVSLGTIGGNQCGMAGTAAYQYVHDGLVDACEYHDYGYSAAAMPTGPDLLAQRVNDCANLPRGPKPLFIGEAGIQGNVQPDGGPTACKPWPACTSVPVTPESLVRRAQLFDAKIKAASLAGVVGYLIWVKSPYYSPTGEIYAIGDGDPAEGVLAGVLGPAGEPEEPPAPLRPTITEVKPCSKSAFVRWTPPDTPAPPVGYEVRASTGVTKSVAGTATSVMVTGLADNEPYIFTVTARGPDRSGEESAPSASVVPRRSAECRGLG